MIEFFRHEALNLVTAIAGFTEILERLSDSGQNGTQEPLRAQLAAIRNESSFFHTTLLSFRNECALVGISGSDFSRLPPDTDIALYLDDKCRERFFLLRSAALKIHGLTGSTDRPDHEDGKFVQRLVMIHESATGLVELFNRPVGYIQQAMRDHLSE